MPPTEAAEAALPVSATFCLGIEEPQACASLPGAEKRREGLLQLVAAPGYRDMPGQRRGVLIWEAGRG